MAAEPNWRVVNPHMIATTCSHRHIQSVIEDAQRDIVLVEAERDALRALTGRGVHALADVVRCLLETGHYADEEGEDTAALVELLEHLRTPGVTPCAEPQQENGK